MTNHRHFSVTLIRHKTIYPSGTLPPHDPDVDLTNTDQINLIAGLIPQQSDWWSAPSAVAKNSTSLKSRAKPRSQSTHDAIYEQRFGDWHGVEIADIWQQISHLEKTNWFFLHPDITPPNGESFNDVITRLEPVMDEITRHDGDDLVLIYHGLSHQSVSGFDDGAQPCSSPRL